MKALKFKLYNNKRNRYLHRTINTAGIIYNHCIALHKRYYRLFKKHLNCNKLQKHIAKLRRRNPQLQLVGSQAVQDICQRIDKAYQLFFKHHKKGTRPPSFKKVRKYSSFTLKQAGYKFLGANRVRIGNKVYSFWKSKEIEGTVKTVTVKRSKTGELYLVIVVDGEAKPNILAATGKTAGFDFGLKSFLTSSDNEQIKSPEFYKQSLKELAKANRQFSKKRKGSNNWHKARLNLGRKYEAVANKRRDWFWLLAHKLTEKYDVLCFETLNLEAMKRLWGRKVSDLGFACFLEILQTVAAKKDKQVVFIDRWYPSSKTCNHCGIVRDKLPLDIRRWRCECGADNDRDTNAAINIHTVGTSTVALGDIRRAKPAIAV